MAVEGALDPLAQTVSVSSSDVENFSWTATPGARWLKVSPASGSGAHDVSVQVTLGSLTAASSPYESGVSFASDVEGSPDTWLTVTLTVLPKRDPGTPFVVAATSTSQLDPSVGYCVAAQRYTIAWAEGTAIYASVLDVLGGPLWGPVKLSMDVQGEASHPDVVVDELTATAWVIWEQHVSSDTVGFVQGRRISLGTLKPSSVFGIVGGYASLEYPKAVSCQPLDEFGLAYTAAGDDGTPVRIARVDVTTRDVVTETELTDAASSCEDPNIAYDSDHKEYLVLWSLHYVNESSVEEARVQAQRVDAITGAAVGEPLFLEDAQTSSPRVESLPVAAYNTNDKAWVVLWRSAESTAATAYTLRVALFPAGEDAPEIQHVTAAPDALGIGHMLVYGDTCAQYLLAWGVTSSEDQILVSRRMTASGYFLANSAAFPNEEGRQRAPGAVYNTARNEYFVVWREGSLTPQVRAMRVAGGTNDNDGDGLPNDWELRYGLDPENGFGDNGPQGDPDGDGAINAVELIMGTSPVLADTDSDGLSDAQEDANGNGTVDSRETSALLSDTDGDGANDGAEHFLGTDPTSASESPGTAIYRLEYGAWHEGVTGPLKVYVYVRTAGTFQLSLNSAGGEWLPPDGWSAVLSEGTASQSLNAGTHEFVLNVTPVAPVTPATDHGVFVFRLTGTGASSGTMTAVLVADEHATGTGSATMDAETLARTYAPVIRLHRDEFYRVDPVELTFERAQLSLGNGHLLSAPVDSLDLAQSPQQESRMDLPGDTVDALRALYPSADTAPDPVLYYTVTTIGDRSVADNPPAAHVALQYYVHFFANDWGHETAGGHRHEGDWEVLQILFDDTLTPYRVTATQQWQLARDGGAAGSASRTWFNIEKMDDTHPVVFAGGGGHSFYFQPGATRYASGLEVHDGLGAWMIPTGDNVLVATDYPHTRSAKLVALGRLGEDAAPGWLSYAGLWGQENAAQEFDDLATVSIRSGPLGPAFMGTASSATSDTGVASLWTDPYGWAMRSALEASEKNTQVQGTLPESLFGSTVVLSDARGRVYRVQSDALSGAFALTVPAQNYLMTVVRTDTQGKETFAAAARFNNGYGQTPLFPTLPDGNTVLSGLTLDGIYLNESSVYGQTNADGDGLMDAVDPDQDNDGIANSADADALGDGWLDTYQIQDTDGDGICNYYDDDDDADGTSDSGDTDANGDGVLDADAPVDTDADGFIDAVDLDIDNDGFSNQEELAAGSDPYFFFDTPLRNVADIDGDGTVSSTDFQAIIDMALRRTPYQLWVDFNGSGNIDAVDVQKVRNRL